MLECATLRQHSVGSLHNYVRFHIFARRAVSFALSKISECATRFWSLVQRCSTAPFDSSQSPVLATVHLAHRSGPAIVPPSCNRACLPIAVRQADGVFQCLRCLRTRNLLREKTIDPGDDPTPAPPHQRRHVDTNRSNLADSRSVRDRTLSRAMDLHGESLLKCGANYSTRLRGSTIHMSGRSNRVRADETSPPVSRCLISAWLLRSIFHKPGEWSEILFNNYHLRDRRQEAHKAGQYARYRLARASKQDRNDFRVQIKQAMTAIRAAATVDEYHVD